MSIKLPILQLSLSFGLAPECQDKELEVYVCLTYMHTYVHTYLHDMYRLQCTCVSNGSRELHHSYYI